MGTSHGPLVQQLLSNQSALMFLTMGGSSYCGSGSGSLNSSAFIGTPRDSMVDVRGSTGSTRKRSQLIARDSGSSFGSESSINQTNIMHHSHTFTTGLSPQTEEEESIRRTSSTGSINHLTRRERERSKDSNDSSNEETVESAYISDTASFSIGGSQLTLNSVSSAVSPSQVSSCVSSPRPSIDFSMPTTENNGTRSIPSPKRSPMLKSLSQDASSSYRPDIKWKEISVSEPALDSPKAASLRTRRPGASPSEEGNSSDSSVLEERPPSADSRKKSKKWFPNGFTGSLKIGRSKKKDSIIVEKESLKDFPKI